MDPQTPPTIYYTAPTALAWERMKAILFRPFDIAKWFSLGFSAWLATLLEGGGSGGGNFPSGGDPGSRGQEFESFMSFVHEHLLVIIAVAAVVLLMLIAISLALLWVSSRGKFMLLDNVVHNRALVKAPWAQFKALGHSLFLWRLGFGLVCLGVILIGLGLPGFFLFTTYQAGAVSGGWIAGVVATVLVVLMLSLVMGYIGILLEDFVIPVMYKFNQSSTEAWSTFLALHGRNAGKFILYFLWRFLLQMGAGIVVIAIILITCCIAGCLMALPYLGAVILLPVTVFFRALSLEFLKQFGGDFDLWPRLPEPPELPPTL